MSIECLIDSMVASLKKAQQLHDARTRQIVTCFCHDHLRALDDKLRTALAEEACEELLDALPAEMKAGQRALEALEIYRAHDLPCPEWALAEIDACYHAFKYGAPEGGWTSVEREQLAARTLGEAFGISPQEGAREAMRTRRLRAMLQPVLVGMFSGPHALKRNVEGYKEAGLRIGLNWKMVERWLPKTRRNTKGNSRNRAASMGPKANNPFNL